MGEATANGSGAWSFDTAVLSYAAHSFTATATDLAGNTSASSTALAVTVSNPPPPAPSITGFADDSGVSGDGITNDTTLNLSGTAETGATVKVYDGVDLLGETTADALGAWSFTTAVLGEGPHSFTATAANAGGTGPASPALPVTIDTTAPDPGTLVFNDYLDTGANTSDDVTADKSFTLAVTGQEAGVSVAFEMKQGAGPWGAADTANLADGTYQFRAVVTDAAGNVAYTDEHEVTVDTLAPLAGNLVLGNYEDTGSNGSDDVTQDKDFTLSITGEEPGASVAFEMKLGDGPWTGVNTSNLADGIYTFRGVVTDLAGNVSYTDEREVTVDNTAPLAGNLVLGDYEDTGANGSDDVTQDKDFTLSVTGEEPGTSVAFQMKLGAGPWTAANTSNLADGIYTFRGVVTDLAGNVSYTAERTVTVDNTAPAPGTLTLSNYVDSNVVGDDVTNDKSFNLGITGQEAGAAVVFQMKQGAGPWSAADTSNLADGTYQFRGEVTDLAGNVSHTPERTITVDTVAPAAPSAQLAVDTGVSNSDGITQNGLINVTLAGDATAWRYTTDGGLTWATGAGTSFTLADNTTYAAGKIQVVQSDLAGNASSAFSLGAIKVDNLLNAAPDAISVNEDAISENLYASLLANDGETGLVIKEVNAILTAMPTGTGNNLLNFPTGSQLVTFEASDSDLDVLEPGQTQTAKFTYKAEDLAGNTAIQTVTVTVQGMVEAIGSGIYKGTNNNDTLQGSADVDKLHALSGDDVIIGGGGADILLGGAGNDTFHFDWVSEFGDQLFDFQNGTATSAADKVRFNVGVGQIEIGDNDTVVETGEVIFYVDRQYSTAELNALASSDAQGHLMIARMSDTNAATIWYDAPGSGALVRVLEFVNMKSAKDLADMSFQDFLFV
ncbi:Ig-like domain-containing protein [Phenylobacterium sp.]|uniref:Ig-like domain-containing protein n=1 Tax=Phenylobacterium sp. TaxID=1871053 RepID=UPI002ED89EFC